MDLAGELKKIWNVKLTVTSIAVGTFETVPHNMKKKLWKLGISGTMETIQATIWLKSATIPRQVLEINGDL